ncbi:MAG: hypothetical protein AAF740_12805, partial [Bacteroidota bacterium]
EVNITQNGDDLMHFSLSATFAEVLKLWQDNTEFQDAYSDLLADSPFESFYWETPPLTRAGLSKAFEFVLVKGRNLHLVSPKPADFEEYFDTEDEVVSFWNLGKNALLVSPTPKHEDNTAYTHLANFVRKAPKMQQRAFWRKVGQEYEKMITDEPRWLSTAGMGVHWLHARLAQRPKYYRYKPYKVFPS